MNDMFSENADKAIGEAIDKASKKICRKVNLDDFDPGNQKSQKDCRPFFDREIDKKSHKISEDQDALDLVSYSATLGWLYGYSCAQEEALSTISAEDDEISYQDDEIEGSSRYWSDAQEDLTEEAANSESSPDNDIDESEEPESTDKEGLLRRLRRAKDCLGIGIAIGAGITIIVCVIIDWLM